VVSSDSHYQAKGIDFDKLRSRTRTVTGLREYAVSKLANVLFAQELARRLDGTGVTPTACTPAWSPRRSGDGCRGRSGRSSRAGC